MRTEIFKRFIPRVMFILLALLCVTLNGQDLDFSTLTKATKEQVLGAAELLSLIFLVVLLIGAILVGWAYASKKEDAQKWLIAWLVGLGFYIIAFLNVILKAIQAL